MLDRRFGARRLVCIFVFVVALAATGQSQQLASDAASSEPLLALRLQPAPAFRVTEPTKPKPVVDRKFVVFSAVVMGLTIADLERTQHCLGNRTCVEMNPMLPHTRVGMYAVNVPINAMTMYLAYRMKSAQRKTWWILPSLVAAGHGVGASARF